MSDVPTAIQDTDAVRLPKIPILRVNVINEYISVSHVIMQPGKGHRRTYISSMVVIALIVLVRSSAGVDALFSSKGAFPALAAIF